MKRFSAIIFDLDGVLIDSSPAHQKAYAQILAPFAKVSWSYHDIAGMRTDEAIRNILSRAKVQLPAYEVDRLVLEKRRLAHQYLKETKPISVGCEEVVKKLSQDYQLAIGTSASRRQLELFFAISGVGKYFRLSVSGDEVERAKPDPEIYLTVATKLKTPPEDCVVIEDSIAGLDAATGAGMSTIWMDRGEFQLPQKYSVLGTVKTLREIEANL